VINLAHAFQAYGLYGVDSGDVGGVSQIAIGFLVTVNFICRICSQDFDVDGRGQVQLRMEYTARAEMPPLAGDFLLDLATLARELRCVNIDQADTVSHKALTFFRF
jgi:hypothetical protein